MGVPDHPRSGHGLGCPLSVPLQPAARPLATVSLSPCPTPSLPRHLPWVVALTSLQTSLKLHLLLGHHPPRGTPSSRHRPTALPFAGAPGQAGGPPLASCAGQTPGRLAPLSSAAASPASLPPAPSHLCVSHSPALEPSVAPRDTPGTPLRSTPGSLWSDLSFFPLLQSPVRPPPLKLCLNEHSVPFPNTPCSFGTLYLCTCCSPPWNALPRLGRLGPQSPFTLDRRPRRSRSQEPRSVHVCDPVVGNCEMRPE